MESDNFFSFLSRSIQILQKESQENYKNIALELNEIRTRVFCGITRTVYFQDMRLIISDEEKSIDVYAAFDNSTILALIDGRHSILDAVLSEKLKIQGNLDDLYKLSAAINKYLNGALRSPGCVPLLHQYRRSLRDGG